MKYRKLITIIIGALIVSLPGISSAGSRIEGAVVEIVRSRAGLQVILKSNGDIYQFGLGTKNGTLTDRRIKDWESKVNKMKPGDQIIIEYSEPLYKHEDHTTTMYYGVAIRAQTAR